MNIKKVIAKVLNKLNVSLTKEIKLQIPKIINDLKACSSGEVISKLNNFRENTEVSDAQFGEIMNRIIDARVFMNLDHTPDLNKIKELKKITDHPPIKVYFDRTY